MENTTFWRNSFIEAISSLKRQNNYVTLKLPHTCSNSKQKAAMHYKIIWEFSDEVKSKLIALKLVKRDDKPFFNDVELIKDEDKWQRSINEDFVQKSKTHVFVAHSSLAKLIVSIKLSVTKETFLLTCLKWRLCWRHSFCANEKICTERTISEWKHNKL